MKSLGILIKLLKKDSIFTSRFHQFNTNSILMLDFLT
ncbi:hypothetical protein BSNT_08397 [Bacillus subtilis subsp. natto BEST195]|nr:hypothetical protein BSNT_08397 [Bacillus subtilis subsp. natto BEST195]